jgi:hypothetical protein
MLHRRYKIAGTSVLLPNGDVLVTSGARVADLLPAGGSVFHEVPGPFPAAYRFAATALLPGGEVLNAGGYDDTNENTAGIWRFGLRSVTFTGCGTGASHPERSCSRRSSICSAAP